MRVTVGKHPSQNVDKVFLNGVVQEFVRVADTDEGFVEKLCPYIRDGWQAFETDGDNVKVQRVEGRVGILFKDGTRAGEF